MKGLRVSLILMCTVLSSSFSEGADSRSRSAAAVVPPQSEGPLAPEEFGGQEGWTVVPLARFVPNMSGVRYITTVGAYWALTADATDGVFRAPIDLPPGTEVTEVCEFAYDNDADHQTTFSIVQTEMGDSSGLPRVDLVPGTLVSTGVSSRPGYTRLCSSPTSPLLIRSFDDANGDGRSTWLAYELAVQLQYSTDLQLNFGGALIRWRRTVSPSPTAASFIDVPPSNPVFRFVEALKSAGIAGGCAPNRFCPNDPVTRGQMAVFLAVALGLHWAF